MKKMKLMLFLAGLSVFFMGCGATGIRHAHVVDAIYPSSAALDIKTVGHVTSVSAFNGNLYIAGQDGIAAMDGSGKILWALPLPWGEIRLLDVDAGNVAFTVYTPGSTVKDGQTSLTLFKGFKVDSFKDARFGLVTHNGELVWTADSSEASKLSPPTLAKDTIGVTRINTFALLDRKTGKEIAKVDVGASGLFGGLVKGASSQSPCPKPVLANGAFYVAHFQNLLKIDAASGKQLESRSRFGLFSPFIQITAGPIQFQDMLVFGNTHVIKASYIFAANADLGEKWSEKITDKHKHLMADNTFAGAASIASNNDQIFMATNFHIWAFDKKGNDLWERQNKDGGLYPGQYRGLQYGESLIPEIGWFSGNVWGTERYPGNQMIATDKKVYITSAYNQGDALTVLDAKSGDYIESIDTKTKILDMAIFGPKIALATTDGLKLMEVK